jgi:hypothetical protein
MTGAARCYFGHMPIPSTVRMVPLPRLEGEDMAVA